MNAQNLSAVGGIPMEWLRDEKWRLYTFAKYPHNATKSAILLAKAGFAYIGSGKDSDDTVACFFCREMKRAWREDEDIAETHRALSSDCAMVTGTGGGNIPLIAPDNVSFGRTLAACHTYDCVEPSQETGMATPTRQHQQPVRPQGASNNPKPRVQLATHTVMSPPPPRPGVTQYQAVGDSTGQGQVSYESGTSSIVTSSNTVPSCQEQVTACDQRRIPPSAPTPTPSNQISTITSGTQFPKLVTEESTHNHSYDVILSTSAIDTQCLAPTSALCSQTTPGILTETPKRPDLDYRKRLVTFTNSWPSDHPLKKEDLADAGFYYTGRRDCVTCFFCGGTLREWEQGDDEWVAHARWFPKCEYLRLRLGANCIDKITSLVKKQGNAKEQISFQKVVEEMGVDPSIFQIDSKGTSLKNDAAILAVCQIGFQERNVLRVAASLKKSHSLSADTIFTALTEEGVPQPAYINPGSISRDKARNHELLKTLKQKNNALRLQTSCKICKDKEVAVVFLPCGHLVCCTKCASAVTVCPVCRKQINGVVRAFLV